MSGVAATGLHGLKTQEFLDIYEFSLRSRTGCIGIQNLKVIFE